MTKIEIRLESAVFILVHIIVRIIFKMQSRELVYSSVIQYLITERLQFNPIIVHLIFSFHDVTSLNIVVDNFFQLFVSVDEVTLAKAALHPCFVGFMDLQNFESLLFCSQILYYHKYKHWPLIIHKVTQLYYFFCANLMLEHNTSTRRLNWLLFVFQISLILIHRIYCFLYVSEFVSDNQHRFFICNQESLHLIFILKSETYELPLRERKELFIF